MTYFGAHWRDAPLRHPARKLSEAHEFLAPLAGLAKAGSARLLDAGCGDAVHASALPAVATGIEYVGVDIAETALRKGRALAKSEARFVAADMGVLPFRGETFDAVISFGALTYTSDPARSFRELCRVLRPGGLMGLWVFPHRGGLTGLAFSLVRRLCRAGGTWVTGRIADVIVPVLGLLPTRSGVSLANASWGACREVVLVNIAPDVLAFPRPAEVDGWFVANRLDRIAGALGPPLTAWGIKRRDAN